MNLNFADIATAATVAMDEIYDALGCLRMADVSRTRSLSTRFCPEDVGLPDDVMEELKGACVYEIVAELKLAMFQPMYVSEEIKVIGTYDQTQEIQDLYSGEPATCHTTIDSAFERAALVLGKAWGIINPTVLTVMRTHGFKVVEDGIFIGNHLGVRVVLDQYARDDTPVVFGTDNAILVSGDAVVRSLGTIFDPNTLEPLTTLATTHRYDIDPNKLYKLKIEVARLGCFL